MKIQILRKNNIKNITFLSHSEKFESFLKNYKSRQNVKITKTENWVEII